MFELKSRCSFSETAAIKLTVESALFRQPPRGKASPNFPNSKLKIHNQQFKITFYDGGRMPGDGMSPFLIILRRLQQRAQCSELRLRFTPRDYLSPFGCPQGSDNFIALPPVSALSRLHWGLIVCRPRSWALILATPCRARAVSMARHCFLCGAAAEFKIRKS